MPLFGTVQNEQGNILENIKIVAYCLHFVDTSVVNEEPSGYFERIILGETVSNADGKYERRYSSSLLPAGLLLDSKEDYGKDKASLYAEAYEEKYNKKSTKSKKRFGLIVYFVYTNLRRVRRTALKARMYLTAKSKKKSSFFSCTAMFD